MTDAELRIVFSDDASQPAQPSGPPPESLPSQSGAQQTAGAPQQASPPAPTQPQPLTQAEAKQLFEQFGLKPSQVNIPVSGGGEGLPVRIVGGDGDSATGPVRRPRQPQEPQSQSVDDILPQHAGYSQAPGTPMEPFVKPPPVATGPMAPVEFRDPTAPPPPPVGADLAEAGGKAAAKAGGQAAAEEAGAGPSSGLLSRALGAAGKSAVSGAAGEAGGAVAGSAGGAAAGVAGSELLAALGPAAIAVGGFAVAIGAAVIGIKTFVDTLATEADKVKDYSPDVAYANAQNEVRQILAMQGRAEAVGPQLGQFTSDIGRANEAAAEVWTEILGILTEIYTTFRPLVEFGVDSLKLIAAEVAVFKATVERAIPGGDEKAERERLRKATERLAKAFAAFFEDDAMPTDDMFTLQLEGVLNRLHGMRGGDSRPKAKGRDFGPGADGMARWSRRLPGRGGFGV